MANKGFFFYYAGIIFLIVAIAMSGLLLGVIAVHEDQDDDNYYRDEEDFEDQNLIQICCAWGDEIEDGILTYTIDEEDSQLREAVYNSIKEWDRKIEGLVFEEVPNRHNVDVDVEIHFRRDGGYKAGETRNYFDRYGFLTKSHVIISESSFDTGFDLDQIEQIAKHEMGHILGLGHATFDGSLMTENVNPYAGSVSDCEINAVHEANQWKLEEDSNFPDIQKKNM